MPWEHIGELLATFIAQKSGVEVLRVLERGRREACFHVWSNKRPEGKFYNLFGGQSDERNMVVYVNVGGTEKMGRLGGWEPGAFQRQWVGSGGQLLLRINLFCSVWIGH